MDTAQFYYITKKPQFYPLDSEVKTELFVMMASEIMKPQCPVKNYMEIGNLLPILMVMLVVTMISGLMISVVIVDRKPKSKNVPTPHGESITVILPLSVSNYIVLEVDQL